MGANKSKTLTEIVNETSAEVILQNMQNCQSNTSQVQEVNVTGFGFGNTYEQTANINLSCAANFKMNNDIAMQIANQISQKAETQGIALVGIGTFNKSEAIAKINNRINARITSELVQKTVLRVQQNQILNQGGVQIGATFKQTSAVIQKALMESVANTGLAYEIANSVDQRAITKQTGPFDFLANIWFYFLLFILIIVVAIIYAIAK